MTPPQIGNLPYYYQLPSSNTDWMTRRLLRWRKMIIFIWNSEPFTVNFLVLFTIIQCSIVYSNSLSSKPVTIFAWIAHRPWNCLRHHTPWSTTFRDGTGRSNFTDYAQRLSSQRTFWRGLNRLKSSNAHGINIYSRWARGSYEEWAVSSQDSAVSCSKVAMSK